MFVRIVKLSFHEENIAAFLENFELMKEYSINVGSFVRYSITPFTPTPLLREVP